MEGLMMDAQLSITTIMRHAEMVASDREIVSRMTDGRIHRYSYASAFKRARQLANALDEISVGAESRVGTLAWNDYRHFELHYAIPCSGRVCHTINPKLFPEQIKFIINDADDEALFIDPQFLPLIESMCDELPSVKHWVALCSEVDLPASSLPGLVSYEALISRQSSSFEWPELSETRASGLCYTSGTTAIPKVFWVATGARYCTVWRRTWLAVWG